MIEDLVRAAGEDDETAVEQLAELADDDPRSLAGYLGTLLEHGVTWPGTLYRAAGPEVVRRIVEMIDAGDHAGRLHNLLTALVHTRDPQVGPALSRWQEAPPAGSEALHLKPRDYPRQAGWTVTGRELCSDVAYRITVEEAAPDDFAPACPWCSSPLWTILDVATSVPEVAEILGRAGWPGPRLRVRTCHLCACYTALTCEVTPDGGATWWAGNTRPDWYQPPAGKPEDPPAVRVGIGERRDTPYQASGWSEGGSTWGGHPDWIQDAEYVDCARCGAPMDYLGLLGGADIDDFGEGAYYLFLHAPCGTAAVSYQQS